jgi:hypothetical protein
MRRWTHGNRTAVHSRMNQDTITDATSRKTKDLMDLPLVLEQFKLASAQHISLQSALVWAGCAALFLTAGHAEASDMMHGPQYDLAESEDFWSNVVRYGRFFITVMLGTGSVMLRPFAGLFKKPVTAIIAIISLVGSVVLLKITLEAMLGMSGELEYLPMDSASY